MPFFPRHNKHRSGKSRTRLQSPSTSNLQLLWLVFKEKFFSVSIKVLWNGPNFHCTGNCQTNHNIIWRQHNKLKCNIQHQKRSKYLPCNTVDLYNNCHQKGYFICWLPGDDAGFITIIEVIQSELIFEINRKDNCKENPSYTITSE